MTDNTVRIEHADGIATIQVGSKEMIAIRKDQAEQLLPKSVIAHAINWDDEYLFDSANHTALLSVASPIFFDAVTKDLDLTENLKQGFRMRDVESVLFDFPDIAKELKISKKDLQKSQQLARERTQAMRDAEHPDLIISASGGWRSFQKDKVFLYTADGQGHFADREMYRMRTGQVPLLLNDFKPEPYQPPHGLFPSYLIGILEEDRQVAIGPDVTQMSEVLDTLMDNFRAALLSDAEIRNLQEPSTQETVDKSMKITWKSLNEHEWAADHPLADEEFRREALGAANKRMKGRVAQFLVRDENGLAR